MSDWRARTPDLGKDNRLAGFNADRERLLADVERRVIERVLAGAARGGDHSIEYVLNDVYYSEIRRLEANSGKHRRDLERWRQLGGALLHMSEAEKRGELRRLVHHYGHDIVGSFDPRVFRFVTEVLPPALGFLFSRVGGVREGLAALKQLDTHIQVEGELDTARAVARHGTIVVTPTHSSNMDSVVIGYALDRAGLPPVTYGAGKNLFTNPFISLDRKSVV